PSFEKLGILLAPAPLVTGAAVTWTLSASQICGMPVSAPVTGSLVESNTTVTPFMPTEGFRLVPNPCESCISVPSGCRKKICRAPAFPVPARSAVDSKAAYIPKRSSAGFSLVPVGSIATCVMPKRVALITCRPGAPFPSGSASVSQATVRPFALSEGFPFVATVKLNVGVVGFWNGLTTAIVSSTITAAALRDAGASRGSAASPVGVISTIGGVCRWCASATGAPRTTKTTARTTRMNASYHGSGRADYGEVRERLLQATSAELDAAIAAALAPYRPAVEHLVTIPGGSTTAAQILVAETGTDMSRFPTGGVSS